MGAITVMFSAAWDPKGPAPRDESGGAKSLEGAAIDRGRTVDAPYEAVPRVCGRVRDTITVRYKKERESGE